MSLRKLFLSSALAALCLSQPLFSQINGVEVGGGATAQVISGKSSTVKITDPEGNELAKIPIKKALAHMFIQYPPIRFILSMTQEKADTISVPST